MTHKVFKYTPLGMLGLVSLAMALPACDNSGPILDPDGGTDTEVRSPNAVVDPCTIDFGILEPGESKGQTVRVANTGGGPLQVVDIVVVEGAPFGQFAKVPVAVQPGSAYQFSVRFEPGDGDYGRFTDELKITTDDPDEPVIVCALTGSVSDDADLDGFIAIEAGGDDCDDSDPTINPGADEIWYDGNDQDCSGGSDYDQDGDGYDSRVFWEDTEEKNPESGQIGGDCQDVDATMNPGQEDIWYDGKDSNCDGQNDFDQDGDGYRTAEFGYNDCNDMDADAYPGATEIFNGADDDCNDRIDDKASPETADRKATGELDDEMAGRSIAVADFDDNGTADILIGVHQYDPSGKSARGAVAIFWDNGLEDEDLLGESGDHDVWIAGANSDDQFGFNMISLPDFDGDRTPDVVVSAVSSESKAGAIYVYSGADLQTSTKVDDFSLLITGLPNYQLGGGLGTGDFDGDGLDDLVMFGSHATLNFTYMAMHYGSGSALGEVGWTELDATWYSKCGGEPRYSWYIKTCDGDFTGSSGGDPGAGDHYWGNGHASADIDGDGYDDLLHADQWSDDGGAADSGAAWIVWGRRAEYSNSNSTYKETQTVLATGSGANDFVGAGIGFMPDVDGDGADEVLVLRGSTSKLYLLMGGDDLHSSFRDLDREADAIFTGVADFSGVVNAGDWTGDGVDDVALVFGGEGAGAKGGGLFLFESREWSGTHNADLSVFGSIVGDDFNANFGKGAPITSADLDKDGTTDLVIGDFGYDDTDATKEGAEGAVFVFYNGSE